ncbi:hypothetical protein CDL12_06221 [Handroanthus impetiginosus]|uniref:Uncharacterized protein n=1 Tax=Handroanthus impetiginosus TaxID=429701 RepID=A0A2G9HUE3_9LAMI|nr:hypothetical protein CDL12_06221 [Handroanthus impetiginosus]
MWKKIILLHLGWMDIGYVGRKDEPPVVTNTNTLQEIVLYDRWERSNCLSHDMVRDLLKALDNQFVASKKALASTLL